MQDETRTNENGIILTLTIQLAHICPLLRVAFPVTVFQIRHDFPSKMIHDNIAY